MSLRRHHCRLCGNLFCNDCSNFYCQLANHKAPVRTCQSCFNVLERLKHVHQEEIELPVEAEETASALRPRHNSQAVHNSSMSESGPLITPPTPTFVRGRTAPAGIPPAAAGGNSFGGEHNHQSPPTPLTPRSRLPNFGSPLASGSSPVPPGAGGGGGSSPVPPAFARSASSVGLNSAVSEQTRER